MITNAQARLALRAERFEAIRAVKDAIRHPYAWPGGYPKYVVMHDGDAMSVDGARECFRQIVASTLFDYGSCDGWRAEGAEINYEDPALFCCHTGERIESAYAEDEAES